MPNVRTSIKIKGWWKIPTRIMYMALQIYPDAWRAWPHLSAFWICRILFLAMYTLGAKMDVYISKPKRTPKILGFFARPKYMTGWWFQTCFNFSPYLGKWSNLTSIFFRWVGSTTNYLMYYKYRGPLSYTRKPVPTRKATCLIGH